MAMGSQKKEFDFSEKAPKVGIQIGWLTKLAKIVAE